MIGFNYLHSAFIDNDWMSNSHETNTTSFMPDPTKRDPRLPVAATIEDLWERKRRLGKPANPYSKQYLVKALIPFTKRYKSKAFRKRADARHWAIEMAGKLRAGLVAGSSCPILEFLDQYLAEMKARNLAPGYIRHAEATVRALHDGGAKDMNDPSFAGRARELLLNRKAVTTNADGTVRRQTKKSVSPSTINRYIAAAKSFSRYLFEAGHAHKDPLANLRKVAEPKLLKPVLTMREIQALLDPKLADQPYYKRSDDKIITTAKKVEAKDRVLIGVLITIPENRRMQNVREKIKKALVDVSFHERKAHRCHA